MDYFVLNGNRIKAADFDFNLVADLEENGVSMSQIGKKIIPAIRVYVSRCTGFDVETAGQLINQHMVSGGNLEEVIKMFNKKADESDFFRAISKTEETNLIEKEKTVEVESEKVTSIKKKTTKA